MIKVIVEYTIIGNTLAKLESNVIEDPSTTEYEKITANYLNEYTKISSKQYTKTPDTKNILDNIGK